MTVTAASSFDPASNDDMMTTASAGADTENVKVQKLLYTVNINMHIKKIILLYDNAL